MKPCCCLEVCGYEALERPYGVLAILFVEMRLRGKKMIANWQVFATGTHPRTRMGDISSTLEAASGRNAAKE